MRRAEWPEWLKNADTEYENVTITATGCVIWHDGIWHGGVWHGGDWRGGVWHGGDWHGGVWHGGDWRGGVWHGGIWQGGDWHGGVWHGGDWRGGDDNPTRCMFNVRGSGDAIRVGCKSFTINEAEALCENGELPDDAPARGSDNGRLLRAAVLAQIAWQRALKGGAE